MSGAGSKKQLSEVPSVHPDAKVEDFHLGAWTEVGKGSMLKAGYMGDWSYIAENCHVVWATNEKMCSIANAARINAE